MAKCDCKKTATRAHARSIGGVVEKAEILIESSCIEFKAPDESEEMIFVAQRALDGDTDEVSVKGKAPAAGPAICVNRISVTLKAGTTAGLQITEVSTGVDTYAAAVPVGGTQVFTTAPCESCDLGTARVKIVDVAGALWASLGGFKICECTPG